MQIPFIDFPTFLDNYKKSTKGKHLHFNDLNWNKTLRHISFHFLTLSRPHSCKTIESNSVLSKHVAKNLHTRKN